MVRDRRTLTRTKLILSNMKAKVIGVFAIS
jgi:hypothetical protein